MIDLEKKNSKYELSEDQQQAGSI